MTSLRRSAMTARCLTHIALDWLAGANQVPVAKSIINPGHTWPEFIFRHPIVRIIEHRIKGIPGLDKLIPASILNLKPLQRHYKLTGTSPWPGYPG